MISFRLVASRLTTLFKEPAVINTTAAIAALTALTDNVQAVAQRAIAIRDSAAGATAQDQAAIDDLTHALETANGAIAQARDALGTP